MKIIDKETWERRAHFEYFNSLDYPYIDITGNIDITDLYKTIKERKLPVFLTILYFTTRVANEIDEFKMRIRGDEIVLHDMVRPSFTVLNEDKTFSYCTVDYIENYEKFIENTKSEMDYIKKNPSIKDEENMDDMLFITSIPWVSFTSITHPINLKIKDSFPRISWGKIYDDNGKIKLPLSIFGNHGLLDGLHIGEFFKNLENYIKENYKYL